MTTASPPRSSAQGGSAREVVQTYLLTNTTALRRADAAARRDEPDAIHQMRVSLRRLRSALRSFQLLFDRDWADRTRDELSWLGGELGGYRESEVLAARFATYSEPGTSLARSALDEVLRARFGKAREATVTALNSARYRDLREALDAGCRHPRTTERADGAALAVLPECVAREWALLARRAAGVLDAERDTPAPDGKWHAARIAAKRTRYAINAVAPAFDRRAAALGRRMSDVTDGLGEHQDAAQAAELAAALSSELAADPEAADTIASLGVVHGIERDRVSMARQEFAELWPKVNTPELTGWFIR